MRFVAQHALVGVSVLYSLLSAIAAFGFADLEGDIQRQFEQRAFCPFDWDVKNVLTAIYPQELHRSVNDTQALIDYSNDFFSAADEEPPDNFRRAISKIKEEMHAYPNLTLQEAWGMAVYSSNGGYALQDCLHAGLPFMYDKNAPDADHEVIELSANECALSVRWIDWVRSASRLLSKESHLAPKQELWRCISLESAQTFQKGDVYAERGFLSTSHGKCPTMFGQAALHFIDPPKNDGFLIEPFSPEPKEHEFLIMPGHWFLVSEILEGEAAQGFKMVLELQHCGTYNNPLPKCLQMLAGSSFEHRIRHLPGANMSGVNCTAYSWNTKRAEIVAVIV